MGRAKLYDPQHAIEAIKASFWANGFEGTSLQMLETATGLPKQTLYREFGDKRQMYLAALADYERSEIRSAAEVMRSAADARAAFAALFDMILADAMQCEDRHGCFLCNASADRTSINHTISGAVEDALERWRTVLSDTLEKSGLDTQLTDPMLAGYIGLRILSRAGARVAQLQHAVSGLLSLLPDED
ncbi:TetR/AcrR family transcriptional regulator [Parerythrobacter jejuensis]|uniref:TetR family transcriptional regulator n=1 Tax=Parerythrobacter jejuensis TaxID=795812 RepID=A0A845AXX5_9SPHN|nr:TetR/AcrR family transcriptional regulator [Parerythrobacter jejuensis]MXP31618.1 TetR family transcriptional regulator [Parerythrobacter jejuensis]